MSPALVGLGAVAVYGLALVGWRLARTTSPLVLGGLVLADGARPQRSLVGAGRRAIARSLGPLVLRSMGNRARRRIEHCLDAAGRPQRQTIGDVAGTKAADTVTCFVIGVGACAITPFLLLPITLYGYFRQDLRLQAKAKKRQVRVERDLADYLDVLGVTIQAGLKFRGALRRVGEQFESPVSEEFRIALQQIDVGSSRRAAFTGVRERNDSPSLDKFVGALLLAEELGAPLTDAMVSIAQDMRKSFSQDVRKRAARAAPKVTLVATVLLMPGAALLLLGGLLIGGDVNFGGAFGG